MSYIGDFALGDTFDTKFCTVGTTGAPTVLAGSPVISAYVGNSTTQLTAGITLSVDFDSVVGLNNVRVVATSGNGYATASNYQLVITAGTVGGTSVVGYVVGQFSIEARSALRPTTAARTLDVSAGGEAGVDWANVGSPTTALNLSGTNIDVDQIVASVSGAVASVTGNVGGNVLGAVSGAVGSVTGNVGGSVTGSVGSVTGQVGSIGTAGITAGSFAAGAIDAAAIASDAITDAKVASDVTIASVTGAVGSVTGAVGSVTGAVGSVTGAVGSVTGNVGGNVTGTVGSVVGAVGSVTGAVGSIATGGIAAASFASGALDAAALAADAATEIADAILKRDWTSVSGEAARSVLNALRVLRNKVDLVTTPGTMLVKEEDDTTDAWTADLTTDVAALPITSVDPT